MPPPPLPCTFYVFDYRSLASRRPPRPVEAGVNFEFELTGNRGAALATKYSTYIEESPLLDEFDSYTDRHYNSWVAFARRKRYGKDVKPVLVYGVDMTRDFSMAAYSYEGISLEAGLNVGVPSLTSVAPSVWCTWRTRYTPHTNHGPQDRALPSPEQATDISSLQLTQGRIRPGPFNQCVFVRYYTKRSQGPLGLFPKVIRAGAGPHDLGPGDNTGDTFPALTVQSGTEITDDIGVERDIVVRNTPNVWYQQCCIVLALNIPTG